MILFIILTLVVLLLAIFLIVAVAVGGAVAIVIFGDVIVCIAIIAWIIWKLKKRR